jgi:transcriptional regulator with XRE-family HTH domain
MTPPAPGLTAGGGLMPSRRTIRQVIAAAVQRDGRSQVAIAEAAGMSRPNLNAYLAGRCDLTGESLDRLLRVLGLRLRR